MFRINSIKFHNFRNIFDSEIKLNENSFSTPLGGSMVGIYGTNGSSKSSVGYALSYFSMLTCGISYAFFHDFNNDFGIADNKMSLEFNFDFDSGDKFNGIIISFEFKKAEDDKTYINKETITFKPINKGHPFSYSVIRSNNYLLNSMPTSDVNKLCELFSCSPATIFALLSSSIQNKRSFFLNVEGLDLAYKNISENKTSRVDQFQYLISFMNSYIKNTSFIMPDSYGLSITNNLFAIMSGEENALEIIAKEPNDFFTYSEKSVQRIEQSLSVSNKFMKKVIGDFEVVLKKEELDVKSDGSKTYRVKLMTEKKDGTFSFENESEGIKRLFLISSAISKVMNQEDFILFIDEFDEGVFEVLFGDIISSVSEQCMGQFIFTSHNLRPLETMEYNHFIFSTTNPNKRFITLKGIKPKNNLRDIYIKKIMYGDENNLSNYIDDHDILEGLIYES